MQWDGSLVVVPKPSEKEDETPYLPPLWQPITIGSGGSLIYHTIYKAVDYERTKLPPIELIITRPARPCLDSVTIDDAKKPVTLVRYI